MAGDVPYFSPPFWGVSSVVFSVAPPLHLAARALGLDDPPKKRENKRRVQGYN